MAVGVTKLTLTAVLKDSSGTPVDGLYGNTTILFKGCWANYTDLSISGPGEFTSMSEGLKMDTWIHVWISCNTNLYLELLYGI